MSPRDCPQRGRDLKKHPYTHITETFFNERGRRARRGRDHRHQRCAHGIVQIYAQEQRQRRSYDNAATQSGQRTEETSRGGDAEYHAGKGENIHERFTISGSAGKVSFDGELHQADQIVHVELSHEAGAVGIDGLRANFQALRNIFGARSIY